MQDLPVNPGPGSRARKQLDRPQVYGVAAEDIFVNRDRAHHGSGGFAGGRERVGGRSVELARLGGDDAEGLHRRDFEVLGVKRDGAFCLGRDPLGLLFPDLARSARVIDFDRVVRAAPRNDVVIAHDEEGKRGQRLLERIIALADSRRDHLQPGGRRNRQRKRRGVGPVIGVRRVRYRNPEAGREQKSLFARDVQRSAAVSGRDRIVQVDVEFAQAHHGARHLDVDARQVVASVLGGLGLYGGAVDLHRLDRRLRVQVERQPRLVVGREQNPFGQLRVREVDQAQLRPRGDLLFFGDARAR